MHTQSLITQKEMDYIRFYMGDPEVVKRGDLKGGPKAYNTINALLHSGIQNEIDKVREGRVLEIEDSNHIKSYIELCISIYCAMKKYRKEKSQSKEYITYRVDRESMMQEIKGKTWIEGFYSTCKKGFLEEYAHIKENVALIEIHRDESVPYLDFEDLFEGHYAKPEEAEVLIPFGTAIRKMEEVELSDEEKEKYTDMNGNPPCAKYTLFLAGEKCEALIRFSEVSEKKEIRLEEIISDENVKHVQKCLKMLMEMQELDENDLEFYVAWKGKLQSYIYRKIS